MLRAYSSDRMNPGTNVQEPFPSLPRLISDVFTITGLLAVCLRNLRLGHVPEAAYMLAEVILDLMTQKMPGGAKVSAALRARCDASEARLNLILPLVRSFEACIVYR
jgi:hypothetical protein